MKVLWKADLGQGKHDPLEVTHVITKSGSQISAELVVPLDPHQGFEHDRQHLTLLQENEGLLDVIAEQMSALDQLSQELTAAHNPVGPTGIPELDRLVGLAR